MITARGSPCAMIPVTDFCCLLSIVDFLCDCIHGSDFRSQAQAKRKPRVVTARVVDKGGWCTAEEIDSYLDENEA